MHFAVTRDGDNGDGPLPSGTSLSALPASTTGLLVMAGCLFVRTQLIPLCATLVRQWKYLKCFTAKSPSFDRVYLQAI